MHLLLALLLHMPPVLMFHQVDPHSPADRIGRALTISPAQFRAELDYLEKHHLRAVSVDDFLQAVRAHENTRDMVIFTFDDGYEDQYTQAFPILLEYGAHATFFITTANVGKRNHVSWPQIRTMQRSGMSIGGHSVDHINLAALSKSRQRREIDGCLAALRAHAHVNADTYAYPGGTFNRVTESILATEPIELAFTTDPSHVLGVAPRFEEPRVRIKPGVFPRLPSPRE
jgi:peptidoglycan/xylan/chitin deacetylase (PgdA/CDA1 family)